MSDLSTDITLRESARRFLKRQNILFFPSRRQTLRQRILNTKRETSFSR